MILRNTINPIKLIRDFDFSAKSDSDLENRLRALIQSSANRKTQTFEPYAIIAEIIDRKLGIWKIFESTTNVGPLNKYLTLAQILRSKAPFKNHIEYDKDPRFFDSKSFTESLEPILNKWRLNSAEKNVVKTLIYVGEQVGTHKANIYLPGQFYQSFRNLDVEDMFSFRITDSQLMSALMVYDGSIVELDAGEGKTVSAGIPALIHALNGKSVHVITSNDYLAKRDCELLSQMYNSVGISSGYIQNHMENRERQIVYHKDIVYSTIREIGFDYLRDNISTESGSAVTNSLEIAIVDEADHILIDQVLSPLIISGESITNRRAFKKSHEFIKEILYLQKQVVKQLEVEATDAKYSKNFTSILAKLALADPRNYLLKDKIIDAKMRKLITEILESVTFDDQPSSPQDPYFIVESNFTSVMLTRRGQELLELRLGNIFDLGEDLSYESSEETLRRNDLQYSRINQIHQLLRAYVLLRKNFDYVVTGGKIVLVDQMTGRTLPDNRFQHDLHAALEAKENLEILDQYETVAQISIPGLVGRYQQISGLTGTAISARDEFTRMYGLSVKKIPPSMFSLRVDKESQIASNKVGKFRSIIDSTRAANNVGRPVLIGTNSVAESYELSTALKNHGIDHMLLNAINDSEETRIVRDAGNLGSVTIATNMAGRGTDIVVKPDINKAIVNRYTELVTDLFNNGATEVNIKCGTESEYEVLKTVLSQSHYTYKPNKSLKFHNFSLTVLPNPISHSHKKHLDPMSLGKTGQKAITLWSTVLSISVDKILSITNHLNQITKDRPSARYQIDFGLGMLVIGTELNKSRRVDDQLRGRTARQGSFGATKFVLSLKDLPLDKYGAFGFSGNDSNNGHSINNSRQISKIQKLQDIVEQQENLDRAFIQNYWKLMDHQTISYYSARQEILESSIFQTTYPKLAQVFSKTIVDRHFPKMRVRDYQKQFQQMSADVTKSLNLPISDLYGSPIPDLQSELAIRLLNSIDKVNAQIEPEQIDYVGKTVFLQTADNLWKEHMILMENLFQSFSSGMDGIANSLARFKFEAFQEYCNFQALVIEQFLCNLVKSTNTDHLEDRQQSVQLSTDIRSMLEFTLMNETKMEVN